MAGANKNGSWLHSLKFDAGALRDTKMRALKADSRGMKKVGAWGVDEDVKRNVGELSPMGRD
jgi:hypothetical protein